MTYAYSWFGAKEKIDVLYFMVLGTTSKTTKQLAMVLEILVLYCSLHVSVCVRYVGLSQFHCHCGIVWVMTFGENLE